MMPDKSRRNVYLLVYVTDVLLFLLVNTAITLADDVVPSQHGSI